MDRRASIAAKPVLLVPGLLLVGLVILGAAGCGDPGPGPDTRPPEVLRTEPVDGATDVAGDARVRVWFDEALDNQRIVWDDQLHLVRADGANLYGNGSYDLGAHTATLTLAMELLAGETYRVVLEPRICDLAGNCIDQPKSWSFTVAP